METIPKSECCQVGYFQKPHGVKGELVIIFQEKYYESLEETSWIFVDIDGMLVPFRIASEGTRMRSDRSAILALDWVVNQEYAKRLTGKQVYLLNKDIIGEKDEFTTGELAGFQLSGRQEGFIGMIRDVNDYSGNVVLTVESQGRELLVPFNEDLVVTISHAKKEIILDLPPGLLD